MLAPGGDLNHNVLPSFAPRIMRAVGGMIEEKMIFVITTDVRDGGIIVIAMMIICPVLHIGVMMATAIRGDLQQTVR